LIRSRLLMILSFSAVGACMTGPEPADQNQSTAPSEPVEPQADEREPVESVSAQTREVAFQIPGRDLRSDPPRVKSMELFPQVGAAMARLEISYEETLPPQLKILDNETVRTLRDDGQEPDRIAGDGIYSTLIPVTPGMMQSALNMPLGQAQDLPRLMSELPQDGSRGLALPLHPTRSEGASPPVIALETLVNPDPERVLLVRDVAVVEDALRTSDPCISTDPTDANKKWTFGYLIGQMANQAKTGISPSKFATEWLKEWSAKSRTVNSDTVRPVNYFPYRKVAAEALRQWRCHSGMSKCCNIFPLDADGDFDATKQVVKDCNTEASTKSLQMNKAPFRLLAIVNRLDLRHNMFFGEGLAGELRFVFGVLDLDVLQTNSDACFTRQIIHWDRPLTGNEPSERGNPTSTVILEYAVDRKSQADVVAWANQWNQLDAQDFNTRAGHHFYTTQLEAITESVVTAGKGAGKNRANGSELIRIRTNESGDDAFWQLREFVINSTAKVPRSATIKQTPSKQWADGAPRESQLADWINQNETAILNKRHKVPNTDPITGKALLGGQTGHLDVLGQWTAAKRVRNPKARHMFSVATCNGCHGRETNTDFAHIEPRDFGQHAELSQFLTGADFPVLDPVDGTPRFFFDLADRRNDFLGVVTNQVSALSFVPSNRTH
jgi:cytochrome c553